MSKNDSFTSNNEGWGFFFDDPPDGTPNLQSILEIIPSAIVLVNADGKFTYINKHGMELYGINYTGFNMEAHVENVKALRMDGTPFPIEEMPVSHSLKSGQVVRNVEMIIQNVRGVKYPVNVSSSALRDANGKISGAIVVFEDFTEREQNKKELLEAQEKLRQKAEDKYHMLFNAIDQGFFIIDIICDENDKPIDMYYVEANDVATKMLGSDFVGRRLREIDPNYEDYWFDIFGNVALTGQSVRMDRYADPDKKWYSFYIFRIGDEKSRRIGNIFLDITRRKQAEKEIIEATEIIKIEQALKETQEKLLFAEYEKNKALETAMKMKDEFLGTISHEFKTPLSVINAALQTIESLYGSQLTDNVRKHLQRIRTNSLRQLRLVNNLLDITKHNAGHLKVNKKNLDIVFLTKSITKSVELYAKQKGIELIFSKDCEFKEMAIDEETYERILLNLLSNAIKFSPKEKNIHLHLSCKNRRAVITVKDEGVGIPKDKQQLIFERFGQVDNSLTRQSEGTGIGLSLVKKLVEGMSGTITIKSEVGKGSIFAVTLPITKTRRKEQELKSIESHDKRIMQAAAIEFSDIYMD